MEKSSASAAADREKEEGERKRGPVRGLSLSRNMQSSPIEDALGNCTVIMSLNGMGGRRRRKREGVRNRQGEREGRIARNIL